LAGACHHHQRYLPGDALPGDDSGHGVAWFGVGLYALVAIFSIITLPVELDASARAKKLLYQYNIVDQRELSGVNSVLNAAAWTYVVAALAALLELARWIFILMGRRRD
jgi:Zn-dependent membrane protease YugP